MKLLPTYLGVILFSTSCITLKEVSLFDEIPQENILPNVGGFFAVNILRDQLNSEVWYTENAACLQVRQESEQVYAGNGAVYLKWDKQEGGCEWIGMGIGWDAWTGKNLEPILNKAAIQFKARIPKGKIQSLPLAVSLEDYGGNAAWLGIFPELITYQGNEDWATITLPLERFGWDEFGADPGNIKQMIIQFEAAGEMWLDEITITEYQGLRNQPYLAHWIDDSNIKLDGDLSDWTQMNTLKLDQHHLTLAFSAHWMYFSGVICDETPRNNPFSGKEVTKADGFELLIGLNPDAYPGRKQRLLSDQHLAINASTNPQVFDLRKEGNPVSGARILMSDVTCGYQFEGAVPMAYFGLGNLQPDKAYAFEAALNFGPEKGNKKQLRWNSNHRNGYAENPSLWGKILVKSMINPQ